MKPFSEQYLFEMNQTGSFYATGSATSLGEKPGTFSGPLSSKDIVRVSFDVKNPVKMLAKSSSIYYFDRAAGQWRLPPNSITDHVGPFEKFAVSTLYWSPQLGSVAYPVGRRGTEGTYVMEDYKGFDPYGYAVTSGSLDIYRQVGEVNTDTVAYNQTIDKLGFRVVGFAPIPDLLTQDLEKSVQRSTVYDAAEEQTFTLDIDRPFMIEKAVVEVPFNMGESWFQDRTMLFQTGITGSFASEANPSPDSSVFDAGGPGITFSLFSQKTYGRGKIRDLILSGVITHHRDNKRFENFTLPIPEIPTTAMYVYGTGMQNSTVVVSPNEGTMFTGSVRMPLAAAVSNGIPSLTFNIFILTGSVDPAVEPDDGGDVLFTPETYLELFQTTLSSTVLPARRRIAGNLDGTFGDVVFLPRGYDVYGRGATGFAPSGGSILGKEYSAPVYTGREQNNPYYIDNIDDRETTYLDLETTITSLAAPFSLPSEPYPGAPFPWYSDGIIAIILEILDAASFPSVSVASPYLVRPGEKMVLAMSKTRPLTSSSNIRIPDDVSADVGRGSLRSQTYFTGSSSGHDVTLATGSINITFYGSYVREGSSYRR